MENQTVKIKGGVITSVSTSMQYDLQEANFTTVDAKGLYMCPGLIDCERGVHPVGCELIEQATRISWNEGL